MTIAFPRPIINNARMSECWFDLIDNVQGSPSANGNLINMTQIADPTWQGHFVTGILNLDDQAIWSAWHKSLKGGLNSFIAYDVRKKAPRAYPTAAQASDIQSAWNGTAHTSAIGTDGTIGLTGLPSTYQFKIGDRVGLEQDGHYGYYELLEDVTASGGAVTIDVAGLAPLQASLFTAGTAICRVFQALCQFMVDQSSWSEQGTVENTPISFTGTQRL